jgi:hypothetical protein
MDLPVADRARRGLAMLQAGLLGPKEGPPARDPQTLALLFDSMRRAVDHRTAPRGPFTVQWEFTDAAPWHLRVEDGSTAVGPGRAAQIDLEVRCRYEDWVDVVAGRLDPGRALATGRLRPHGTPRALWRARGLF